MMSKTNANKTVTLESKVSKLFSITEFVVHLKKKKNKFLKDDLHDIQYMISALSKPARNAKHH